MPLPEQRGPQRPPPRDPDDGGSRNGARRAAALRRRRPPGCLLADRRGDRRRHLRLRAKARGSRHRRRRADREPHRHGRRRRPHLLGDLRLGRQRELVGRRQVAGREGRRGERRPERADLDLHGRCATGRRSHHRRRGSRPDSGRDRQARVGVLRRPDAAVGRARQGLRQGRLGQAGDDLRDPRRGVDRPGRRGARRGRPGRIRGPLRDAATRADRDPRDRHRRQRHEARRRAQHHPARAAHGRALGPRHLLGVEAPPGRDHEPRQHGQGHRPRARPEGRVRHRRVRLRRAAGREDGRRARRHEPRGSRERSPFEGRQGDRPARRLPRPDPLRLGLGEREAEAGRPDAGRRPGYSGYGGFTNFANPAVRDYNIDIAKAGVAAGVDEILYDYVRRPDGPIEAMRFPGLGDAPVDRSIASFVRETREQLPTETFLGASVFGVAASGPTTSGRTSR